MPVESEHPTHVAKDINTTIQSAQKSACKMAAHAQLVCKLSGAANFY